MRTNKTMSSYLVSRFTAIIEAQWGLSQNAYILQMKCSNAIFFKSSYFTTNPITFFSKSAIEKHSSMIQVKTWRRTGDNYWYELWCKLIRIIGFTIVHVNNEWHIGLKYNFCLSNEKTPHSLMVKYKVTSIANIVEHCQCLNTKNITQTALKNARTTTIYYLESCKMVNKIQWNEFQSMQFSSSSKCCNCRYWGSGRYLY